MIIYVYLNLINAYVLLFGEKTDFEKAKSIFEKIIIADTDNNFAYAHYIGIIFAYIKLGNHQKATEYFDKLPVTNSICDFDDRPWPLEINIVFEKQYKTIFENISIMFSKDLARKNKTAALYALYLYSPSTMFDIYRYSKTDAAVLARYLKNEFNSEVAAALYDMRCHYKQFKEAYEVLWSFLTEYKSPESKDVFLLEITENATDDERSADIYEKLVQKEPQNSSAINNLGVQYEHRQELFKALEYYQKALAITPVDDIQQRNLKRIHELICVHIITQH